MHRNPFVAPHERRCRRRRGVNPQGEASSRFRESNSRPVVPTTGNELTKLSSVLYSDTLSQRHLISFDRGKRKEKKETEE
jgi:hypothetical protein